MPVNAGITQSLHHLRDDLHRHADTLGQLTEDQQAHETDHANPHADTAALLGLGVLENHPLASVEEAATGVSLDRYLNPALADVVWGNHAEEQKTDFAVRQPEGVYPTSGQMDIGRSPSLLASAYAYVLVTPSPLIMREYELDVRGGNYSAPLWAGGVSGEGPVAVSMTLEYSKSYQWRVRDTAADGEVSRWSRSLLFTTAAYVTRPLTILTPVDGGGVAIGDSITWEPFTESDVEGFYTLVHYVVEVSTDAGSSSVVMTDTVLTPEYVVGTDLPREIEMWVRVRPVWVESVIPVWSDVSAFTVDVAILPPVTLTTPTEGAVVISGSDAVVWSAYTDSDPIGEYAFDQYRLQWSRDAQFSAPLEFVVLTRSFTVPTLEEGNWYVRVRPEWVETGVVSVWSSGRRYILETAQSWVVAIGGMNEDVYRGAVALPEGDVVTVGHQASDAQGSSDAFISRWSRGGVHRWSRALGGSGEDRYLSVAALLEGDVVAVGHQASDSQGGTDALISRWTIEGVHLWSYSLGGLSEDAYHAVTTLPTGDLVAVGYQTSDTVGVDAALISRWTAEGVHVWSHSLKAAYKDHYLSVTVLLTGDLIAVGYRLTGPQGSSVVIVSRWTADGVLVWTRSLSGTSGGYRYTSVTTLPTGDLVAVGDRSSSEVGASDALISRWTADGVLVWSRTVQGNADDLYLSVSTLISGEVIAVGRRGTDTLVSLWSSDGMHDWSRGLGGDGDDAFYGVATLPEGDVVAVGHQASDSQGGIDALVVRYPTEAAFLPGAGALTNSANVQHLAYDLTLMDSALTPTTLALVSVTPTLALTLPTLIVATLVLTTYKSE